MAIRKLSKPVGSVPAAFHGDSFVSERLGFVYHCVPKALSRSMLQYLEALDPEGYRIGKRNVGVTILPQGLIGLPVPLLKRVETEELTSFTFARNPYSRIVAVYYDKFVNYRDTPAQRAIFAPYKRLRPDMPFPEFVDWLATDEGSDEHADPHFLSQHYFFLDLDGKPAVDYLGKVESSEEDVPELQRFLGLKRQPLPRINSNTTRERMRFNTAEHWLEPLDDRSKRILANRYEGDFEFLGYPRLPYQTVPLFSRGGGARHRGVSAENSRRDGSKGSPLRRVRVVVNRLLAPLGFEVRRTRKRSRGIGGVN